MSGSSLHDGKVTSCKDFKPGDRCKHSPATTGRVDAIRLGGNRSLVCRGRARHACVSVEGRSPPGRREGGRDVSRKRVCWGLCNQAPAGLWRELDVNSWAKVGRNRAPVELFRGGRQRGVWNYYLETLRKLKDGRHAHSWTPEQLLTLHVNFSVSVCNTCL